MYHYTKFGMASICVSGHLLPPELSTLWLAEIILHI